MRTRPLAFVLLIFAGAALAQTPPADPPAPAAPEVPEGPRRLKGYDPEGGAGKILYEVDVEGTIDLGLAAFVERVADRATANDVLLVRIKTFGGRVDAAVRIRDALLGAAATTVVYVDRRAISAGALISLAADTLIMSPGSSMGAATPVQGTPTGEMKPTSEKVVSYMRAEMRSTAEAKGRRKDLAEAMVDADIEIDGVTPKGKLLTLTGERALELGIIDAVLADYGSVIAHLNLGAAERVRVDTHWAEKLARLLTDPMVSSLLMVFGFLGLLIEFYTPGFGVAGIVGISCLALFFLGQYSAQLAGWEELILLLVGIVLLAIELFITPGFGVLGISGILCILVALIMAMVEFDLPLGVAWDLGYIQSAIQSALTRIVILLVVMVAGLAVATKYFPSSRLASWLVFRADRAPQDESVSGLGAEEPGGSLLRDLDGLEGARGRTKSVLRPAGIAVFGGRRIHVLSDGEYIPNDALVEVVEVDGHRVMVRVVQSDESDGSEPGPHEPPPSVAAADPASQAEPPAEAPASPPPDDDHTPAAG